MKSIKYFSLGKDEVHVWTASLLDAQNNLCHFISLLSEDELERANGFKFIKDRNQYIVGRGILRCLLAKYVKEVPQSIEFVYGLWGKPYLLQKESLYFNISHSRDYIVFVITRDYEIGVDIEYIDKNLKLEDMALNILSPAELIYWGTLQPNEKADFFFKLWACKEAYLKALGKGWLENNNAIPIESLCTLKKQKTSLLSNKTTYPYILRCIPGYASAVYINGPTLRIKQLVWNNEFIC